MREIAIAHGGSIEVTSDANETVFTVRLPRRDKPKQGDVPISLTKVS